MGLDNIKSDFPFLNDVKLKNKAKDGVIIKSIKFNEDEAILLKYMEYFGKKFSSYLKELVVRDIYNSLGSKNNNADLIELENIKNIDEDYILKLIERVLNKKDDKKEIEEDNEECIELADEEDLKSLGIPSRR